MKKLITHSGSMICFFLVVLFSGYRAQTFTWTAPPDQQVQSFMEMPSPDISSAYRRTLFFISKHEMAPYSNLSITSVSIPIAINTNTSAAVGSFSLYMDNSPTLGFWGFPSFTSNTANMIKVYAGSLTIPAAGVPFITVNFQIPFTYTGAGVRVAMDWQYGGPYLNAVSLSGNTIFNSAVNSAPHTWAVSGSAQAAPVQTLSSFSNFRPACIFGVQNLVANDLQVLDVYAPGTILSNGGNIPVETYVCNSGTTSAQNVTVSLRSAGANTFTNNVLINSLPAGATQTVSFQLPAALYAGLSTETVVILNGDQVSANNSIAFNQSVTCNEYATSYPMSSYPWAWWMFNDDAMLVPLTSPSTRTLTAVRTKCAAYNFPPGQYMYPVLIDAQGNILAQGATVTPQSGQSVTMPLQFPTIINPNQDYFFGVAAGVTGVFPVGIETGSQNYTPMRGYYRMAQGGPPMELYDGIGLNYALFAQFNYTSPQLTASTNTYICAGSTVTLQAQSPQTFSWSTGATSNSIAVSPGVTTIYRVTAFNSICNISKTIAVNVSAQPTLVITTPQFCKDAETQVGVSGAWSYTWSNGVSANNTSYAFSSTGTQTISVMGQNVPCPPVTAVKQVTVRALPSVSLTSPQIEFCNPSVGGTPVQLTGSPQGGIYSGSLSAAGVFSPLVNGTYQVSYKYTHPTTQCSNTASLMLSVSDCTGFREYGQGPLSIYPNPSADGKFRIQANDHSFRMYNMEGREIPLKYTDGVLDLGAQLNGAYLLLDVHTGQTYRLVKME